MSFLRQLWKQKPESWGPVDKVQASLFKNAERIGIDANTIALAMPMWGPGNQLDYSKIYFGINYGAAYINNNLNFDGINDYVSTPRMFPNRNATIFIPSFMFKTANQFNRILHSCVDTTTDNQFGIYVQTSSTNKFQLSYTNGTVAGSNSRKTFETYSTFQGNIAYNVAFVVRDSLQSMSIIVDNQQHTGQYSGTATTYNPGTKNGGIGVLDNLSTLYFGNISMEAILCFDIALKDSQIASLSDNPCQLWQRVSPVSYFIPGSTPGGLLEFSGNISAISNILGQIRKAAYLDGSISAVSNASGNVSKSASISGSVDATASTTGNITVAKTLTGSITGQSAVTGSLSVSRVLLGNVSAIADIQGQITLAGYLQMSGNIGAVAEAVGSMALAKTLSGNISAIADVDGQVAALKRLSGFIDAVADVQGSVTIESDNKIQFSGNIGAMAAIQGSLGINKGLTGAIQATSAVDGNIYVAVNLTGSAEAIADVIGNMRVIGAGSLGVIIDPYLTSISKKLILKSLTNRLSTKQI